MDDFDRREYVVPSTGLIKCYNGTYKCESQTETLEDWLGPWISFLWLIFLLISIFAVRMLYVTFIQFRDTLTYKDDAGEYQFKEECIYEHETAFGVWDISKKKTIQKCKTIYFAFSIPMLIAWLDLFLDITYVSSFTLDATRMVSAFIEVRVGIFILMGVFDILGTFRIFLCSAMLWKFSQKLYTKDEKLLAQLETTMEVVVVAFAFILEDFAELFIEYFCVEKYITGYEYEKETTQSFTAALSSITLNLVALLCFIGFITRFRKQQENQSYGMRILSVIIPLFELVLSSLRTYRFLWQAYFWKRYRPGCVYLQVARVEEDGIPIYKAHQDTFSEQCFRPLDWIMIVLMCIYCVILIIFVIVYVTRIRPEYELEMEKIVPTNLVGDPKKLPKEMVKLIPSPIVKTTEVVADGTKTALSYIVPGKKSEKEADSESIEKSTLTNGNDESKA